MRLNIFSCASWPSVCLLWRNVCLELLPSFWLGCLFLILSCMHCLHILEINPLSIASFKKILSHSVGCLFILFMVFFAMQKLLSLIRFHLFLLLITGGGESKNILLQFTSENVQPVFSSKHYILTFKS